MGSNIFLPQAWLYLVPVVTNGRFATVKLGFSYNPSSFRLSSTMAFTRSQHSLMKLCNPTRVFSIRSESETESETDSEGAKAYVNSIEVYEESKLQETTTLLEKTSVESDNNQERKQLGNIMGIILDKKAIEASDSEERVTPDIRDMLEKVLKLVSGKNVDHKPIKQKKIKGTVVLMKNNVLDMNDDGSSSFIDGFLQLFGTGVSLQLITSLPTHTGNGSKGMLGKAANLEKWDGKLIVSDTAEDAAFQIQFEWDESMSIPGAFLIRNNHHKKFYIKTLTLDDVPGHGQLHFICNSWVYPAHRYKYNRVFFANKTYLPSNTPDSLRPYREEELINLRGNGTGMLKEWERVYDYAYYNDLGSPEKGADHVRPVLGGSKEYPYPRRGRTGRAPNWRDPKTESRLPLVNLNIYVPRDERFNHVKFSEFISYSFKSIGQVLVPEIAALFDETINEFDSFQDVLDLYEGGHDLNLLDTPALKETRQFIPFKMIKQLIQSSNNKSLKFPTPDVIKVDKTAWRTDEEFAREMLAGLNPVVITRLQEFPPASKLDHNVYGNQNSSITREQIETNMNGLTVDQALEENKLFILDHHDALMPYLRRINKTNSKLYASRTILLLQDDGTLKPLAIELSLPRSEEDIDGCTSHVLTPAERGIEGSFWQLAKAYVAVNDSGYHQLISHWLNTHAVIEPFVIATNRQLSVLHPIFKLLHPHFRDTMNINALARHTLVNAGGILEMTVYPRKYAMEMSSAIYKDWNFTEQAHPADLLKRGMAVPDSSKPHGIRLLVEDYPFAVDGLEIWSSIEEWVKEYCTIYYPTDDIVQNDSELQSWWAELRDVGHGDLKDKPWWPKMQTLEELVQTCTIIIWVASALHAAVNFGQYSYAGFLPNRPTVSRRLMPKPGTAEYAELESNPDLVFLKTITAQFQTLLGISLIEILSIHSRDEIYLGQTENPEWTADHQALEAFKRFGVNLVQVEEQITKRNADNGLKNRSGPVKFPYTLLYPSTSDKSKIGGLTGKGIPNSVSI